MPQDTDGRAHLEAERDRLVARLNKGHCAYFGGFGGDRSARLAREDPVRYHQAEALWIALLHQYEGMCDRLAALECPGGEARSGHDDDGLQDRQLAGGPTPPAQGAARVAAAPAPGPRGSRAHRAQWVPDCLAYPRWCCALRAAACRSSVPCSAPVLAAAPPCSSLSLRRCNTASSSVRCCCCAS